jgi:hypothetical protein
MPKSTTDQLIQLGGLALTVYGVIAWAIPWLIKQPWWPKPASGTQPLAPCVGPDCGNAQDSSDVYDTILNSPDTPGAAYALIQQGYADKLSALGMGGLLANQTAATQALAQQQAFGWMLTTPQYGGGRSNTVQPQRAM